jgi:hypothetical protein
VIHARYRTGTESVPPMPAYFTMMHAPTFINPKQFGRFFGRHIKNNLTSYTVWRQSDDQHGREMGEQVEFINDMPKTLRSAWWRRWHFRSKKTYRGQCHDCRRNALQC